MLTSDDIRYMAHSGEGYNVEFKESVPQKVRELAEEICAFANSAGGYLVIGVDDKNDIVHRDYYDKGARTMVEVFNDRVVITNPGGLISSIPPEKFGTMSRTRNPLIFGLFERIRLVEYVGSGVMRMRESMKEEQLPAPGFGLKGMFDITLVRPVTMEDEVDELPDELPDDLHDKLHDKNLHDKLHDKSQAMSETMLMIPVSVEDDVDEKIGELSEIQQKILDLFQKQPKITIPEIGKELSYSIRNISYAMKQLKALGYIERTGSRKSGEWNVLHDKLHDKDLHDKLHDKLPNQLYEDDKILSDYQKVIIDMIAENKHVTSHEIAENLSITDKEVRSLLQQLKELGYIDRIGFNKNGYWELIRKTSYELPDKIDEKVNELTEIQQKVFDLIRNNENITTDKISETLSISRRYATSIIKHLKSLDYIERDGSDKTGIWKVKLNLFPVLFPVFPILFPVFPVLFPVFSVLFPVNFLIN